MQHMGNVCWLATGGYIEVDVREPSIKLVLTGEGEVVCFSFNGLYPEAACVCVIVNTSDMLDFGQNDDVEDVGVL